MLSVLWIGHIVGQASTDIRTMVVWSVIAMVVAICYGVLALGLYINRTAARLLKTHAFPGNRNTCRLARSGLFSL